MRLHQQQLQHRVRAPAAGGCPRLCAGKKGAAARPLECRTGGAQQRRCLRERHSGVGSADRAALARAGSRRASRRAVCVRAAAAAAARGPVVVIDNYDSFTYNLCQVGRSLGRREGHELIAASLGSSSSSSSRAAALQQHYRASWCRSTEQGQGNGARREHMGVRKSGGSRACRLPCAVSGRLGVRVRGVQERREDGGGDPRHEPPGHPGLARPRCGRGAQPMGPCSHRGHRRPVAAVPLMVLSELRARAQQHAC